MPAAAEATAARHEKRSQRAARLPRAAPRLRSRACLSPRAQRAPRAGRLANVAAAHRALRLGGGVQTGGDAGLEHSCDERVRPKWRRHHVPHTRMPRRRGRSLAGQVHRPVAPGRQEERAGEEACESETRGGKRWRRPHLTTTVRAPSATQASKASARVGGASSICAACTTARPLDAFSASTTPPRSAFDSARRLPWSTSTTPTHSAGSAAGAASPEHPARERCLHPPAGRTPR